jgi:hypothetical protein
MKVLNFGRNVGGMKEQPLPQKQEESRQGCSLSPHLFNIFTDNIMEYINVDNSSASLKG